MGSMSRFRYYCVFVGGFVVLAVVAAWFVWWRFPHPNSDADKQFPFRECATAVGITWRMNFLADEQGANFKINLYDHGAGLAVGDYDGDGKDDIYFCNQLGKNALYRNKGDGTFEDVTDNAGVGLGDRVCVAAVFVDYDNSGRQSLFVTSTRGGNVLFHNKGDGTFEDVTDQVGLKHDGHSQTPLFFDYDNDGYLDLLLTNTAQWTAEEKDAQGHHYKGVRHLNEAIFSKKEENVLYHNEPVDPKAPSRGRKFVKMPAKAGLNGRGWAADAVAFDYDGDGLMDVYVTSMFGRGQLYRNKGDGTFADVTLKTLGKTPYGGIGCTVLDFNNTGRLDLLTVDMHSDMWMGLDSDHTTQELARRGANKKYSWAFGPALDDPVLREQEVELVRAAGYNRDEVIYGNALYRNDGKGKFEEVSDKAGMETFWPWGIATGDFLNNGREDVFIAAGMGYPFWYWPNALMMNKGNGTFTDRAEKWASSRCRAACSRSKKSTTTMRPALRGVRRPATLTATAGWRLS